MQGDPEVIEFLNEALKNELTAINQYFLHYKMQENFGWTKLAKYTRSESIDEMRHAEVLTDRILFLDGLPNYQRLFHIRVGQTVGEMFRPKVPEDGGMLFDWGVPRESQMWMENTLVPLDMVFINADGTIRSIAEDTTPRSLAVIDSRGPVRATLELAAGVTAKLDIRVGDTVKQRIFGNVP